MAANKLNKDGRQFVITRIIAGDTNSEIRSALAEAGFPPEITDATFSGYRKNKVVVEALQRKDSEAMQSGYAQRSERILKLVQSAKRLERMLLSGPDDKNFAPGPSHKVIMVHREYRDTLRDISELVDPKKATTSKVELSGERGGPVLIKNVDELRKLPADELVRLHRAALGEIAETAS